ncbi:hypothetical protein M441DRAFT_400789 [Trichoderma asperellum CBS 433.97]|uniref:Secreted protein n=1 Tax=Trichoderma asperellum (strain ATCC 204424 / CBS 433.97 / NBRC 101777) TaxID=1042311 RepID=A0A2T3Z9R5_TRIA4|nr:hypothetical protein M441DRAFT_400789 [Trichoderma asperellum CBS 433.97]PTB41553.1 hypothetical protein M441DRAFT_400789 [Trichoderma asperellum CBS 433.97]
MPRDWSRRSRGPILRALARSTLAALVAGKSVEFCLRLWKLGKVHAARAIHGCVYMYQGIQESRNSAGVPSLDSRRRVIECNWRPTLKLLHSIPFWQQIS